MPPKPNMNILEAITNAIYNFFKWCMEYFIADPLKGIILLCVVVVLIFVIIKLIKWFFGTVLNRE